MNKKAQYAIGGWTIVIIFLLGLIAGVVGSLGFFEITGAFLEDDLTLNNSSSNRETVQLLDTHAEGKGSIIFYNPEITIRVRNTGSAGNIYSVSAVCETIENPNILVRSAPNYIPTGEVVKFKMELPTKNLDWKCHSYKVHRETTIV